MKGTVHFSNDVEGYANPKGSNDDLQTLAFWLSDDNPDMDNPGIQLQTHANEMRPFAFYGMGNNYGVYQFEDFVFVRSETDRLENDQILLKTQQVLNLLTEHDAFQNGDRRQTTVEVDYIATGKEAKRQFEELAEVELGKPRIIEWIDEEKAAEAAAKGGA